MGTQMMCKKKKGFSLIELLVVIAIIAILAAILFPLMITAKAKGNTARCASNMKQIGMSFQMYLSDWGDQFGYLMWTTGAGRNAWWEEIRPYAKNKKIHECPSLVISKNIIDQKEWWMGYSVNRYLHAPDGDPNDYVTMSDIQKPTRTILLCETKQVYSYYPYFEWCAYYWVQAKKWGFEPEARHQEGANYTMVDGHVKWMKSGQTVSPELMWDISPSIPVGPPRPGT